MAALLETRDLVKRFGGLIAAGVLGFLGLIADAAFQITSGWFLWRYESAPSGRSTR